MAGTMKDRRTAQVLIRFEDGIKKSRKHPLIPDGVTNELINVVRRDKMVGDATIGSDGFFELIAEVDGRVIKLKRDAKEDKIYLSVFP